MEERLEAIEKRLDTIEQMPRLLLKECDAVPQNQEGVREYLRR